MDTNLIIQAISKNLVQAQQESKLPATGDELALLTAIENPKINKSSVEDLKQVLRLIFIKIGLRAKNWPSDEEKFVLIEHIIKNFGNHTCEEIKLAFDMAISGKLEVDVNAYENFSCLYLSNIMNAYRSWSKEAYKHIPKNEKISIENIVVGSSDEEMAEWILEWKIKINTIKNPVLIPSMFYTWLVEKGKLSLTNKQKNDYLFNHAVEIRIYNLTELAKQEGEHGESRKQLNEFNIMRNKGVFEGIEVERLKEIAKKVAVFFWLKNESDNESN